MCRHDGLFKFDSLVVVGLVGLWFIRSVVGWFVGFFALRSMCISVHSFGGLFVCMVVCLFACSCIHSFICLSVCMIDALFVCCFVCFVGLGDCWFICWPVSCFVVFVFGGVFVCCRVVVYVFVVLVVVGLCG